MRKTLVAISCMILAGVPSFAAFNGTEYPHSASYGFGCDSCHWEVYSPMDPPAWTIFVPQNIDDTSFNVLCWHCHNGIVAPYKKTHSSVSTDVRYGNWSMECRTCHSPHQQQKGYYGSASFLHQGTISFLSDNTLKGAGGWTDNQFKGFVVTPNNIQWPDYGYKLLRNSSDTLYVSGPMDLGRAAPGDTFVVTYGKLIKSSIATPSSGKKQVKFFRDAGLNSFADGDSTIDGICQVCHTQTTYHKSDGSGAGSHNAATKCTTCHSHGNGFKGTGGDSGSHLVHTALVTCEGGTTGCHGANPPPLMEDGQDRQNTTRCDSCHSPGGAYDGVNDPVIGSKANWTSGTSLVYSGGNLVAGKEKWCAGCHDESPSVVNGVSAPNVVGDESGFYPYGRGWGYYKTGHGLAAGVYPASQGPAANLGCVACHDFTAPHIDNNPRTYSVADDNYQGGYRLNRSMDIPRTDSGQPASDFQLCVDCHLYGTYLTQADNTTNFRKDPTLPNSHWLHLQAPTTGQFAGGGWWDSDWDGTGDSKISCPACHNVHGSVSPRMLQHGELISTPGTTDKVPSFNVRYFPFTPAPYPPLPSSTGLGFYPTVTGGGTVANNGVCAMCHSNSIAYYRTVTNLPPKITSVHGRAGGNILTAVFSEGVYTNAGASGAVDASDFTFTDVDNGRTVTGVTHAAGADTALLTLSSALDATNDVGTDTLAAATATSIYDNQSRPMGTAPVTVSGEGPFTQTLHPSGMASNTAGFIPFSTPAGSQWSAVLDRHDGDISYAYRNSAVFGTAYLLTMDMDNPAGLAPATIQSITVTVYARHLKSGSPYASSVSIGYKTGTNLVLGTPYLTDASGDYNLISATYTTNSDGGPLTTADIDNLQVAVKRENGTDVCETRITEIKADVAYLYQQ